MISIREQIEAFQKAMPKQQTGQQVCAERRARILVLLRTKRTTREIAKLLAITMALTKHYLRKMEDRGLVACDEMGYWRLL